MNDKADKKTIGVVPDLASTLQALVEAGHFEHELDAAKFAMAYAIEQGAQPGFADGAGTKWNVGTFDGDGSLRSVIEALYPEEATPYRLAEHFINDGLRRLKRSDGLAPDVAGLVLAAAKG